MQIFDFGIAHCWEYDIDFVTKLEAVLKQQKMSVIQLTFDNVKQVTEKVKRGTLHIRNYLDRAWDEDEIFGNLGKLLVANNTRIFNHYDKVPHAIDKATMHLEFITAGLNVPYSIIIPPLSEAENIYISLKDLAVLGRPFIIKPCNTTGGGVGVVTGAETLSEILRERFVNTNDKYLLQKKIYPKYFNGKRGWFRCFWAFNEAIPLWWDDTTHAYQPLSGNEVLHYELEPLFSLTQKIAGIIELDFFSTEIAIDDQHTFIVIDYVNDQCDMRMQSSHFDGVPDYVVDKIIVNLLNEVALTKPRRTRTISKKAVVVEKTPVKKVVAKVAKPTKKETPAKKVTAKKLTAAVKTKKAETKKKKPETK